MAHSNTTDLELIQRSLAGDTDAYGTLIRTYNSRIFTLILRMTNNTQEAEDITQEAFIKAYEKLDEFKLQYRFFSWLCTIAVNIAKNRLKRRSLLTFLSLDKPKKDGTGESYSREVPDRQNSPEEDLLKKEEHGKINELIYSLPLKYRDIFLMRNLEDMSYTDIAEATGLPLGTVETRLHRATKLITEGYRSFFKDMK